MIDRFGQYIHKDWPGKIHSDGDLAEHREQEAADLAAHPGPKGWDQYGGWLDGPKLEATGRFRVTKWRDKWWLVDPDGRLFWSHGLVRVTWSCGYTPITGRRFLFAELPQARFALRRLLRPQHVGRPGALRAGHGDLQLHRGQPAAQVRPRTGREAFGDVTHRRLRSWGLNTMANCSQPAHLPRAEDALHGHRLQPRLAARGHARRHGLRGDDPRGQPRDRGGQRRLGQVSRRVRSQLQGDSAEGGRPAQGQGGRRSLVPGLLPRQRAHLGPRRHVAGRWPC